MPFSDPMADGPAVQASSLRALKAGQTMKKTLELVRAFRAQDQDTPIVLMGYYNPIYVYPRERFPRRRQGGRRRRPHHRRPAAGGRRRAVPAGHRARPQLHPPGHADHGRRAAAGRARQHLGLPLLCVDHRHHRHGGARRGRGSFAHCPIKKSTRLPVAVGFGIKTPQQAKAIAAGADGVVVGSALVNAIRKALGRRAKRLEKRCPTS